MRSLGNSTLVETTGDVIICANGWLCFGSHYGMQLLLLSLFAWRID